LIDSALVPVVEPVQDGRFPNNEVVVFIVLPDELLVVSHVEPLSVSNSKSLILASSPVVTVDNDEVSHVPDRLEVICVPLI
jgi:hypothetical protein